jgi:hypothetical protein
LAQIILFFRNAEIFKKSWGKKKNFVKENEENFEISWNILLLKWNLQN